MARSALFVVLVACGARVPLPAAHAQGVHGMVVFGRDHFFASHLPLYRPPHDWQVVLEVAPTADVAARWRAELGDAALVTFEPEPFDLVRLAPGASDPIHDIAGTVYRGHFERGGTSWQRVTLHVERVLLFRKVDAHAATAKRDFFAFGAGGESYVVHAIGARPDVDEIYAIASPPPIGAAVPVDLDAAALAAAHLVYREVRDLAE
jgi:hypothetical protein